MTLKNTKENAIITLVSRRSAGGEQDKIEFTVPGGFYVKDGKFYITYRENSDTGMGDSRVMLKVEPSMITMRRMGEFNTVMVYKTGEVTDFIYRMPFGELKFDINTESITNALNENGGRLEFSYLLISGGETAKNQICLSVKTERNL